MKNACCSGDGFTLMELVVAMAMAALITAAATTVVLMGLQMGRQASDTADRQMTVRTLLSGMENAAAEGRITALRADSGGWVLADADGRTVFRYCEDEQAIFVHEAPVLRGVSASRAVLDGQLLRITIETGAGTFSAAIYCRMAVTASKVAVDFFPEI